jgi:hypothetical protein
MILTAHFKWRAIRQQIACLFNPSPISEDLACQDQRLGSGAAFRKPACHQQQISTLPWRAGHGFIGPSRPNPKE